MPVLRLLIAAGVALALADASIVTLALPPMLDDLDTTVEGVAAVIGVYTLVLAALLPAAAWLRRRVDDGVLGAAGFGVFALAGALCSLPEDIAGMLAFRALQAAGAAAALVAGFALLRGGRLWTTAAVLGTAVGPALGGALTQAFDWQAIFLFQVPLALAAAGASLAARGRVEREPAIAEPARDARSLVARAGGAGALVALAALSAALTAVLFLLVLLLVSGWSLEPLAAAAAVSVLPLAAFAGARIRAPAALRASAGCALVGAGVLALAVLPGAATAWIVAPQLLAGAGMGMALPALAGELLPGRTPGQAAWLLDGPARGHHARAGPDRADRGRAARRRRVGCARARRGAGARRPPAAAREGRAGRAAGREARHGEPARLAARGARRRGRALRRRSRAAARVRRADRARRRDGRRKHRGLVPDRVRDRRRARAGRRVRGAPAGARAAARSRWR